MNYAEIKEYDIANGPGVRMTLFVSGCRHHCKNCFNEIAWDFNYGNLFDETVEDARVEKLNSSVVRGLTLLGGEPLDPSNQPGVLKLLRKVKKQCPGKDVWCYTGYDFEKDVLGNMYKKYSYTQDLLKNIDIIVDGEFEEQNKIVDLKFRGSTNQKKIDVQASLKLGKAVALKFGDEERYEQKEKTKTPKVIFFKEFEKDSSEENTKESATTISIPFINENIAEIKPAIEVQEVKEKIAAETINNKEAIKL